jgi:hypothetical protein
MIGNCSTIRTTSFCTLAKLKHTEKKAYREMLAEQQGWVCPLCEKEIPKGQETLDHDHGSGHCRMVLCRACNGSEGRVLAWIKRSGADDVVQWIANLSWYWQKDWTDNHIYPAHKNHIEKEIAKLRKQKKKVKLNKTKRRYEEKIQRLQKQLIKEEKRGEASSGTKSKKSGNNSRPRKRTRRKGNQSSV